MRFLGVGTSCDLGAMYQRLMAAGHEVRVYNAELAEHGVMQGLLHHVEDWRKQLGWVREAGADGVIIFETAEQGAEQDQLRREGFFVVGGSALGDRLENDRAFGQAALAQVGLTTAPAHSFDDFDAAIAYIRAHPRRYVFKLNGSAASSWRNYVGQAPDGSDVVALLRGQAARMASIDLSDASFLLMDHVSGIETGIGAYFNGQEFLEPACLDWEHKRFFNANLGELTGEMGTLVTYEHSDTLFALTLKKLAPLLRDGGYVGYINLNTIINAQGVWPLELTCRFGYPGFAVLDTLQPAGWAALFRSLRERTTTHLPTAGGFAIGVVLTVPPFPYAYGYAEISKGLHIAFDAELGADEQRRLHLGEVARPDGQLIASGRVGYLMVATGAGASVEAAQQQAYSLARKVYVPNLRYRTDIGDGFIATGRDTLSTLGYWPRS
jgi:phosphoribosylamine--glycine ligase